MWAPTLEISSFDIFSLFVLFELSFTIMAQQNPNNWQENFKENCLTWVCHFLTAEAGQNFKNPTCADFQSIPSGWQQQREKFPRIKL